MEKIVLEKNQIIRMYQLMKKLNFFCYQRVNELLKSGQYKILGGVIKIFPVNYDVEITIDFFGDKIEKIKKTGLKSVESVDIKANKVYLEDGAKISPGEYIVHIDHGIGIFKRLGLKKVSKVSKEYIFIEYLNNDYLYLPINVETISRFVNNQNQKKILREIKGGKIDLVVGTHRLLSSDLKFKNLGLLVLDEEQKFGVKQRELLIKYRQNIDVISLSATPIPRTLYMSLSGIRDISQINQPPSGRRAIDTKVNIYDKGKINEYILRELKRGGQVYYLYNKVRTIERARKKIQAFFQKHKVKTDHGQMREEELVKVMAEFTDNKINILICSTIIENGIDLSNVNTLIVEEADKFGLSQLYQIRGRIGRGKRQSYCLLTHKDKKITNNAFKRLATLVENSNLGSGFNIALSDLEIRGGGNILGRQQHGNMEAIGLALYTKLLSRATKEYKNRM